MITRARTADQRSQQRIEFVDDMRARTESGHRRTRILFDRARFAECLELAPFAADLAALEMGRRSRRHVTPEEAAKRLDAAKRALDAVRGRVEKGLSKKDDADALKVQGVDKVVRVGDIVAVLAKNTWAAKLGRDALRTASGSADPDRCL